MRILVSVVMSVVTYLRRLGLDVDVDDGVLVDGTRRLDVLDLRSGSVDVRFAAKRRARAPYPNELNQLDTLREFLSPYGEPLLNVPFVSTTLGERLREAGWSWADDEGNLDLRAPGLVIAQRLTVSRSPANRSARLPGGPASSAAIRALIRWPQATPLGTVTSFASMVGVSQPRMSTILATLRDLELTTKTGGEWFVSDRAALLDQFIAEYRRPLEVAQYLYTLDPVSVVAERSAELVETVAVSADVGPDLVAPWRRPSVVVLYSHDWIDSERLGAVEAVGSNAANVFVRKPPDDGVMASGITASLRVDGPKMLLADPAQMLADLIELGGADREEAAEVLRTWIISRP